MFGADQLVAHLIGDYVLQSDWMASEKTKRLWVAFFHAIFYAVPFVLILDGISLPALAIIISTHALIDRFRLARYVTWAKNWIALKFDGDPTPPWSQCTATGFGPEKPTWMAVWLLIIVDNVMHIVINAVALKVFP